MSAVVVAFTTLLTDFGIGTTVITVRDLSPRIISQLHAISLSLGVLLTIVVCLLAPQIAIAFQEPRLSQVLWVLSINFLIAGLSTVPQSILKRDLRFTTVTAIEFTRATVGAVSVLMLAVAGMEFWALAIGNVIAGLVAAAWLIHSAWIRPSMPIWIELRATLRTSRDFLVGTLSWFAYSNADALILGRIGGATALGQYRFALSMSSLPGEKLVNVIGNVSLPIFSAISERREEVAALLFDLTELLSSIILPALTFGALSAPLLVPFVFGERWNGAVVPFQVLCVAAMFQNFQVVNSQVLRCRGLARTGRTVGLVATVIMPLLFISGAKLGGARGVALGWLIGQPVLFLWPLLVLKSDLEFRLVEYLTRFFSAIAGTALVLSSSALAQLMPREASNNATRTALGAGVGVVLYAIALLLFRRQRLTAIFSRLRSR